MIHYDGNKKGYTVKHKETRTILIRYVSNSRREQEVAREIVRNMSNENQSMVINSGSSSSFSLGSSMTSPSSSSFRFLLGLERTWGSAPFDFVLLLGRSAEASAPSRARFREGVDAIGANFGGGLTFLGKTGRGEGKITTGPS